MLEGKIALITGAGRGIGREIALTMAEYGAVVIINYNGSKEKAEQTAQEITQKGKTAITYQCNIAEYGAVQHMVADLENRFGKIDILVNNAGITKDNLVMKMSEEEFDSVIAINLKGAFNCMKHVSRGMIKHRSGSIINLSSVVAVRGNAGQINYCASKAGIIGMTKAMAREVGSRGITVNAIAPGFIGTEMTDVLKEEKRKEIVAGIPLKRIGTVKDIAETAAFLASEKASYITGQVIQVDGGMGM